MTEQLTLKGRTTGADTTLYEAPSYDAPKMGELGKGELFQLIRVQQVNDLLWCSVQTSAGKQGYLVGFLVEICRDRSIAYEGVPVYDAGRRYVGNLAEGWPVRARLPPDPDLQTLEFADRKAWIELETNGGTGYVCGTPSLKIPRLPIPSSRSRSRTGRPVSFAEALPGLALLLVIVGLGFFVLSKVIGMVLSSQSAYEISATIVGIWLALKSLRRR